MCKFKMQKTEEEKVSWIVFTITMNIELQKS